MIFFPQNVNDITSHWKNFHTHVEQTIKHIELFIDILKVNFIPPIYKITNKNI